MSFSELEALIGEYKQKAKLSFVNKEFSSDLLLSLQYLINGFFQAEGNWSGQFQSSSSHRFVPKFSVLFFSFYSYYYKKTKIGQNVSDESLTVYSV